LKEVKRLGNALLEKKPLSYQDLKDIPKKRGIYIISNKKKKIIYVGESNKLKVRLLSDHISGEVKISTSTFRKKLTKEPFNLQPGKKLLGWIKDHCSFRWIEIEDKDLCHATEAFLIAYLRQKREPLLNS
ncbi:MAG: GIY-YIG nuclease family protein, partial [bacterium]|nr:GIY-YIG nuclease family protein [bacterium]